MKDEGPSVEHATLAAARSSPHPATRAISRESDDPLSPVRSLASTPALPVLVCVLGFLPVPLVPVLTVGPVIAAAMAPLQLYAQTRARPLGAFVALAGACWVAMAVTAIFVGSRPGMLTLVLQPFPLAVLWLAWMTLTIRWAASRLGLRLALILVAGSGGIFSLLNLDARGNYFKYHYGLWLIIFLLLLAWRNWRSGLAMVILSALLASVSQVRHLVVFLILAVVLNLCLRGRELRAATVLGGLLAAGGTIMLALKLALAGWLGSAVQTVTRSQAPDGSLATLLTSARPEGPANLSLIIADPGGGNWAARLTTEQIWLVIQAFIRVDRDPNAPYVQDYILSQYRPEFHSLVADFWFYGGVPGIILVIALLAVYARGLAWGATDSSFAGVIVLFLCMRGIWDLAYSPLSDLQYDALFLATVFAIISSSSDRDARGASRQPSSRGRIEATPRS